jgi:hypothetical protein
MEVKTKLKVLPTSLRLFIGLFGIGGFVFCLFHINELIKNPTTLHLLMLSVFSTLTLLFLGFGLFSIKTFIVNEKQIVEVTMWGLIVRKNSIGEIVGFKSHMVSDKLGTFEELVVKKRSGETIFIQEFDQKEFQPLKSTFSKLFTEDKSIKPNYWTKFLITICAMLVFWFGLMMVLNLSSD